MLKLQLNSDINLLRDLSIETVARTGRSVGWRRGLAHSEPLPVLIWITRGQGRSTVAARTRGYGPHSLLYIPARTIFSIDPGAQTQGQLVRLPRFDMAPLPAAPTQFRVYDIAAQAEMTGLIDRMAQAQSHPGPGQGRAVMARIMLISAWLERQLSKTDSPVPPSAAQQLAARFAAQAERDYATGATLADIGTALGVTPTHLTRTLRETCGMTAAAFLNERLMHEARRRLVDTDATAAAIATDLGFSTAAYFTRAFSQATGQTPSAFRAQAKAAPVAR